ncbi:hypothetical protein D3C75_995130 [compost metagenome]
MTDHGRVVARSDDQRPSTVLTPTKPKQDVREGLFATTTATTPPFSQSDRHAFKYVQRVADLASLA